jgi:[acyl-carrier-protein] S-malonyltransferase
MATAFVFPGQGSQRVGMGKAWAESFAESEAAFLEADRALGLPLSRLCFEGPESELQLTANTQPAILAASIAAWRVVAKLAEPPALVAGHSLGEYTAHVAAGALEFGEALRLVRRRGELMQQAVPVGQGAMAAIVGLDATAVARVAAEASRPGDLAEIANYNAPEQTVIAGHAGAVERAVERARAAGARRAVLLPVSAPFHSSLMRPAREGLAPALAAARFGVPRPPVVTNVEARAVTDGKSAREALERQVDGPVRWVESVRWMAGEGGIDRFVEIGPGTVLTGLIRRIAKGVEVANVEEPDDLDALTGAPTEEAEP